MPSLFYAVLPLPIDRLFFMRAPLYARDPRVYIRIYDRLQAATAGYKPRCALPYINVYPRTLARIRRYRRFWLQMHAVHSGVLAHERERVCNSYAPCITARCTPYTRVLRRAALCRRFDMCALPFGIRSRRLASRRAEARLYTNIYSLYT